MSIVRNVDRLVGDNVQILPSIIKQPQGTGSVLKVETLKHKLGLGAKCVDFFKEWIRTCSLAMELQNNSNFDLPIHDNLLRLLHSTNRD